MQKASKILLILGVPNTGHHQVFWSQYNPLVPYH